MDHHDKRKREGNNRGHKRGRNEAEHEAKRRRIDHGDSTNPVYATSYSKEEIENEERKPKRKVAVMIGYNGSGYKGLQLDHAQKTIEGEIFQAFVKAGAISKANADDPKKSSFGRCARTDKGVHAAGNLLSLKLIVEDPEIVRKINQHLSPQIRVWGIQRTNNSFSAYQMVDSRVYEYLIPSSSFLPPHPKSYLGKKLVELAREKGDLGEFENRQEEVKDFWQDVEEKSVNPILENLDENTRKVVLTTLFPMDEIPQKMNKADSKATKPDMEDMNTTVSTDNHERRGTSLQGISPEKLEAAVQTSLLDRLSDGEADAPRPQSTSSSVRETLDTDSAFEAASTGKTSPLEASGVLQPSSAASVQPLMKEIRAADTQPAHESASTEQSSPLESSDKSAEAPTSIQTAIKEIRAAYLSARRAYRIGTKRFDRMKSALQLYHGTRNFHNFTVDKRSDDPSAKRVIKSFVPEPQPILIDGMEWLSLKVQGQSFMIHQIRKMVSMAALVVRCGCDPQRIVEAYGPQRIGIPKSPSLGLLLEQPVFESYNRKCTNLGKEPINFNDYEKEIEEFKQRSIYQKIYQDEARENIFGNFFNHVDTFQSRAFLFVTSGGLQATQGVISEKDTKPEATPTAGIESDEEDEDQGLGVGQDG
ncbi:MAG: hypothetical protein Q9227_002263 [Pyrenula ochraceoflavens]